MRDWVYDVVDLLEILFLEPFRYLDEMKEIPFARRSISHWIFSILGSLSIATGMSLLTPPYTVASVGFLIFGFFANLIVIRFFPFILCVVLDFYAQGKGRAAKVTSLLSFARHSVLLFAMFAPVAMIMVSSGVYGRGYGLLLLFIMILLYAMFVGRGVKYIYDLKDKDAFRFTYYALMITAGFPILFNIYTATTILQSLAGSF